MANLRQAGRSCESNIASTYDRDFHLLCALPQLSEIKDRMQAACLRRSLRYH